MIEQKEASAQIVPQSGIVFSKTLPGQKEHREHWSGGELPYPFTGIEELVSKCIAINFAVIVDNVVYKLQSVSFVATPNLRVH